MRNTCCSLINFGISSLFLMGDLYRLYIEIAGSFFSMPNFPNIFEFQIPTIIFFSFIVNYDKQVKGPFHIVIIPFNAVFSIIFIRSILQKEFIFRHIELYCYWLLFEIQEKDIHFYVR